METYAGDISDYEQSSAFVGERLPLSAEYTSLEETSKERDHQYELHRSTCLHQHCCTNHQYSGANHQNSSTNHQAAQPPYSNKLQQQSLTAGNKGPLVILTVLLVLILLLLVAILAVVLIHIMKDPNVINVNSFDDSNQLTGNWTDEMPRNIVQRIGQSSLNITEYTSAVQSLFYLLNTSDDQSPFFSVIPTSCQEIKQKQPNNPSGVYLLAHADGSGATYTYCNMGELCGSGGGWTRLAYLNMNDATKECPSGFRLYQSGGVRACGRATSNGGSCVSVQFPSNSISYSQVCGRVVGYQYDSPDAVDGQRFSQHNNLSSWYVDGVSITRGSPRQHVWTLIAGLSESNNRIQRISNCPCSNGSSQQVQSFIGDYYFCESGNPNAGTQNSLYTSDPLWDGQDCGSLDTACCSAPGLPWFHRDYGNTTTTDYIELRVCGDEGTNNEDVPVSYYEIYVK